MTVISWHVCHEFVAAHSRREGRAGGVSVYFSNHIDFSVTEKDDGSDLYNLMALTLKLQIYGLYTPPI